MLVSISYWVHIIGLFVFVPFLFLPVKVRQWENAGQSVSSPAFWKGLFHLGHLYIILSLLTGLILAPSYGSSWFWVVILVFLAVGAFLGMTAKYFRLSFEKTEDEYFSKLKRFSTILAICTLAISILMFYRW